MPYEVEGMHPHPGKRAVEFVVFLIIVSSALTLYFNAEMQKKINAHEFPVTDHKEINSILATKNSNLEKSMNHLWIACTVPKEQSLINLVHIRKHDNSYEISCEFGPAYDKVSYSVNGQTPLVYFGWVSGKKCDEEIAREIDNSVRKIDECAMPMLKPIPDDLTDYYVFSLYCRNNLKREYISSPKGTPKCVSSVLGSSNTVQIAYQGVVDLRTGMFWV